MFCDNTILCAPTLFVNIIKGKKGVGTLIINNSNINMLCLPKCSYRRM